MRDFKKKTSHKIQVLFVNLYTEMGGGEQAVYNLVRSLDRERFEPILLFNKRGPFVDKIEALGFKTAIVPYEVVMLQRLLNPLLCWSNLKASLKIRSYIKAHSVQLVHCTDLLSFVLLLPALLLDRIRIVYNVIMYYNPAQRLVFNVLGLLMVRHIAAPSHAVRSFITQRTIGLKSRISVIPNGINSREYFPRSLKEQRSVRALLKIPNKKKIVGLVSRYEVWKGHLAFLGAAKILLAKRDDLIFLTVGGAITAEQIPAVARYRDTVLRRVEELAWGEAIRVLNHREDVAAIIGSLDVLVCPSEQEAFGLVVLEAFASGVPVVASRTVGALEVLQHAQGIFVSEPNDSSSIAQQIESALDYTSHRKRKSYLPSKNMLAQLSWDTYAKQFEELYHQAIR